MDRRFLEYKPDAGYLHHWLVAGPQLIAPSNATDKQDSPTFDRGQMAMRYGRADNEIKETPAELAKFTPSSPESEGEELTWRYFSCEDDHLLDLADEYPQRHYVRSW